MGSRSSVRRARVSASRRLVYGVFAVAVCTGASAACRNPQTVLAQLMDARRLASELHVRFTQAAEASNRAVMADTDDAAAAAAEEARRARQVVERDVQQLQAILASLGYREDLRYLDHFSSRFAEYRRLDDEILPLAAENTNVKAQRLSFGPAREAVDAFRSSIRRGRSNRRDEGHVPCGSRRGTRANGRARDSDRSRAAYRRGRRRGDDANGGSDDGVCRRCSQGAGRAAGDRCHRKRRLSSVQPLRRWIDSCPSTRRSSRCHGATAMCGRSRCPSAESAR